MELYQVLDLFCNRGFKNVSKEDKRRHSFMIKRLFSAQYPMQCHMLNDLSTDPVAASDIIGMLATRYTGLPNFLRMKVSQKKKKESIRKNFEDDVLAKFMELNQCGIREVEEAYNYSPKEITAALKMIKTTFFDDKSKVIVEKVKKKSKEEELW